MEVTEAEAREKEGEASKLQAATLENPLFLCRHLLIVSPVLLSDVGEEVGVVQDSTLRFLKTEPSFGKKELMEDAPSH